MLEDADSKKNPNKFQQIDITSVSGYCMSAPRFKICQPVAVIRIIRQFHEFLKSIFWRVFAIWPKCASGRALLKYISKLIEVAGYNGLTAYDFTRYKFSNDELMLQYFTIDHL